MKKQSSTGSPTLLPHHDSLTEDAGHEGVVLNGKSRRNLSLGGCPLWVTSRHFTAEVSTGAYAEYSRRRQVAAKSVAWWMSALGHKRHFTAEVSTGAYAGYSGRRQAVFPTLFVASGAERPAADGQLHVHHAPWSSPSLSFSRWNISRILAPSDGSSASVSGFHWLRAVLKKSPP